MLSAIIERREEAHERYNHIQVREWPILREQRENIILGSFSWLGMSTHTRWISAYASINAGPYSCTPGDVARDYLATKYQHRSRITAEQRAEIMRLRSHPLKAEPVYLKDAAYVDIRAAYWSIMSVVGWDCDYFPGRWLSPGECMDDFPFYGNKLARNCLVTAGLLGSMSIWDWQRQTTVIRNCGNRLANYQLWALVMDVLNGVAHDMQEIAWYIHTDGYICDTEDLPRAREILTSWGLPSRVKLRGECTIHGAGQYHFGMLEGNRWPSPPTRLVGMGDNRHVNWLRSRFRRLSELASPALPASE